MKDSVKKIIIGFVILITSIGIGAVAYYKDFIIVESPVDFKDAEFILRPCNGTVDFEEYGVTETSLKPIINNRKAVYGFMSEDNTFTYKTHDGVICTQKDVESNRYSIVYQGQYVDSNGFYHMRGYLANGNVYELINNEDHSLQYVGEWIAAKDSIKYKFKPIWKLEDGKSFGNRKWQKMLPPSPEE